MGAYCCRCHNPCRSVEETFEDSICRHYTQPFKENDLSEGNNIFWLGVFRPVLPEEHSSVLPEEVGSVLPEVIDSVLPVEIRSVLPEGNTSVSPEETDSVLPEENDSVLNGERNSVLHEEHDSVLPDEIDSISSDDIDTVSSEENDSVSSVSWFSFEDEFTSVDRNIFMGDERTCCVCVENYNEEDNQPRIIPCGHIICNMCLIRLAKTFRNKKIKCPQDRQVFKLRRRNVYGNQSSEIVGSGLDLIHQDGIPVASVLNISSTQSDSLSSTFNDSDSLETSNFEDRRNFSVPNLRFSNSGISYSSQRFLGNFNYENTETKIPAFVKHLWGEQNVSPEVRCQNVGETCRHISLRSGTHSTACFSEDRIPEPPPDYPLDEDEDIWIHSYA